MPAQTSKIQLSTLLESLPEAIFIVEASGALLEFNHPAERLFSLHAGSSRDQLCGLTLEELRSLIASRAAAQMLEVVAGAVRRALRGERVRNEHGVFEVPANGERGGSADENRTEALISANPMFDREGALMGALVVVRDVTEVNELQSRLASTERDHAIGQMAAGLIHDFNNVLDTVERAITVMELRDNATSEQRHSYLGMMHKAVRRGTEIISRLRQYLRSGTGEVGPVDLRELLEDTIELARPMLQTSHRNVRLHSAIHPVGKVRGNAADLRRVFTNLILNAIQAMPEGGELEVHCERAGDTDATSHPASNTRGIARVLICDTGAGIPAHLQKKIFRPYFTTKSSGTGLGLSGAQRIVLSSGGKIRFHSEPGKGTRFMVELPLASMTDDQQPRNGNHRGGDSGGSADSGHRAAERSTEDRRRLPRAA